MDKEELEEKIDFLYEELETKDQMISDLEDQIEGLENDIQDWNAQYEIRENRVVELEKEIEGLEDEINELEIDINRRDSDIIDREEEISDLQEEISGHKITIQKLEDEIEALESNDINERFEARWLVETLFEEYFRCHGHNARSDIFIGKMEDYLRDERINVDKKWIDKIRSK